MTAHTLLPVIPTKAGIQPDEQPCEAQPGIIPCLFGSMGIGAGGLAGFAYSVGDDVTALCVACLAAALILLPMALCP